MRLSWDQTPDHPAVIPTGLEPVTFSFVARCAIQLRHGTLFTPVVASRGLEPRLSASQAEVLSIGRRDCDLDAGRTHNLRLRRATLYPVELRNRGTIKNPGSLLTSGALVSQNRRGVYPISTSCTAIPLRPSSRRISSSRRSRSEVDTKDGMVRVVMAESILYTERLSLPLRYLLVLLLLYDKDSRKSRELVTFLRIFFPARKAPPR